MQRVNNDDNNIVVYSIFYMYVTYNLYHHLRDIRKHHEIDKSKLLKKIICTQHNTALSGHNIQALFCFDQLQISSTYHIYNYTWFLYSVTNIFVAK